MKQKTLNTLIFILAVIFVVTALASFITKLVPKNESTGVTPDNNTPTPIEPIKKPIVDVDLSENQYIFVGIG